MNIWLVKAYQGNGQLDQAIALCQHLVGSDVQATKIWAELRLDTFYRPA
jgi:hypothetical protein